MLVALIQGILHRLKRPGQASCWVPVAVAILIAVFSGTTLAEIYQWKDADGNVHFGDKPTDPDSAAKAKAVELKSGYEPVQRNQDEEAAFATQQKSFKQANDARRSAEQKKQDEIASKRREEKIARCTVWENKVKQMTQLEDDKNGGQHFYYFVNEDGTSMTVAEQERVIAALREKIARERC